MEGSMYKTLEVNAIQATSIIGSRVRNQDSENVGKIEDFVIDMETGRIAYAVLSFGGFLGMGDKLFAVPFQSMQFDVEDEEFVLNVNIVNIERLKNAPGFDPNHWPKMGEREWGSKIHAYYGQKPYWVDE
jgi:sporulation protein YlmC with PRC-barrel domain